MSRYTRWPFPPHVLLLMAAALAVGAAWPEPSLRAPMPTPRPACLVIDGHRVCDIRHLPSDGAEAPAPRPKMHP